MKKTPISLWRVNILGLDWYARARTPGHAARLAARDAGHQLRSNSDGWFEGVSIAYLGAAK